MRIDIKICCFFFKKRLICTAETIFVSFSSSYNFSQQVKGNFNVMYSSYSFIIQQLVQLKSSLGFSAAVYSPKQQ